MRLAVIALTVVFAGVLARPAAACSCIRGETPCSAFSTAVIFIGEVMTVQRVGDDFHMRLRVVRPVKGIEEPAVDLWSDARSSCGVRLSEGQRYVIYTSRGEGRMSIDACSPTVRIPAGAPDPELPPVPGRVYGRVTRYDIERIRRFQSLDPVAAVRVAIDLPAGRVTATSDAWGQFTFSDVPPGTYEIEVDAGQSLEPWMAKSVTIDGPHACTAASVVLQPSGEITGRVVTAEGRPAEGVYLSLYGEEPDDDLSRILTGTTTRADGRFSFDGLSPGEYRLAVNPGGNPTGREPWPKTFFGGGDAASATRIGVGAGTTEMDKLFVLPKALPRRTFTFAVSCRDGSTPSVVSAEAHTRAEPRRVEHGMTLEGVHTLTLLRDQAYTLVVTPSVPTAPPGAQDKRWRGEKLPAIELPAGQAGRHLTLVAPFTDCAHRY